MTEVIDEIRSVRALDRWQPALPEVPAEAFIVLLHVLQVGDVVQFDVLLGYLEQRVESAGGR